MTARKPNPGRMEAPRSDIWTALKDLVDALDSGETGSIELAHRNARQVVAENKHPWEDE